MLLEELLFHPNRLNNKIINCDIVNKWILNDNTSNKIKSALILYMILYDTQNIKFKIVKYVEKKNGIIVKSIKIQ
jgi:hypothetical protein